MNSKLRFEHLQLYAKFLLENKLFEFACEKLKLLKDYDVPLFRSYQQNNNEKLITLGIERTNSFLSSFNNICENDSYASAELLASKFPFLDDEKISSEDITLISFIQRKLFRDFLTFYTTDNALALKIMEEMDLYTVEMDNLCLNQLSILREKEINEKQNFIHKIAQVTPSLITAYNVHSGKFIYVNNAIKSLLGYDQNEVLEQGNNFFFSKIHPADLPGFLDKNENYLAKANLATNQDSDIILESVYRLQHKNGEYRWFNTYGTVFNRNKENKIEDILNISVDITDEVNAIDELIRTNEELSRSEERYQNMISEVQDYSILLLNREGFIENWNKGAESIKGYKTQEVVGQHFKLFYTESDRNNNIPQQLLDFATINGRAHHEGWRIRKDKKHFWGTTVVTALHDKYGIVTGFTKVTRDLTEMKIAEDKLKEYSKNIEQKNKQLEQANKEMESFNYVASHDLQEPLRKIQSFTSRLLQKEKDNLSDWGKDVFEKIQNSANRMQKLIEALLNFSKLDKYEEQFISTDINFLIEESKNSLAEIMEEKNAIIESDNLSRMDVIPIQFQQLITNLLNNALKYCKPDIPPHIKISSQIITGNTLKGFKVNENAKFYHIKILDNGIGFDQQYSEKIFELFQRLHGKTEYEGTGIGLSISKKIVENHNGIITAKGEPGVGAEFDMYFPIN